VLFGGGVFNPSRLAYAASWLCAAVGMPLMRVTMKAVLRRAGAWGCPAVIYGDQRTIRVVADTLRRAPEIGYSPVGVFTSDAPAGALLEGLPVLGGPREITADAEVAFVPLAEAMLHPLTDSLDRKLSGYRRLILLPELDEDIFLWVHPRPMGGLMGMEVASNLLSAPARMVKRAMDVGLTLLAAPVWLSAVALLGMAIWLSDGGAPFYCRPRMGRRGRPFRPIKFRTMVPDAERRLERALAENPALRAEWEATRKLRDDPRITRAGRLLRRWSLDELPQLLNVLAGTMSLVGPRPLPDYHRADISPGTRRLREQVRPGITGLWQVSGRSESGTAGMEKWDAYYVRNWSVWLDLVILARTVRAVLSGRGAY